MRSIVLVLSVAALAACSSQPAEEQATEETPVASPAPASTSAGVVANGSPAGAYEVTNADGTVMTTNINADGTYSDVDADGNVTEEGTYAVVDGKTCFSPTTEGAEAMCYTETQPAADGSFTATPDTGDAVEVRPLAADPAATQ